MSLANIFVYMTYFLNKIHQNYIAPHLETNFTRSQFTGLMWHSEMSDFYISFRSFVMGTNLGKKKIISLL